jgi:exonuclease I
MLTKIKKLETIKKNHKTSMDVFHIFADQKKYKTGRERQIELLPTFKRTASTNLRISPEKESDRDLEFQDEKYRLKNMSFKHRRRKKKDLRKRRRRHMSQEVVKEFTKAERNS